MCLLNGCPDDIVLQEFCYFCLASLHSAAGGPVVQRSQPAKGSKAKKSKPARVEVVEVAVDGTLVASGTERTADNSQPQRSWRVHSECSMKINKALASLRTQELNRQRHKLCARGTNKDEDITALYVSSSKANPVADRFLSILEPFTNAPAEAGLVEQAVIAEPRKCALCPIPGGLMLPYPSRELCGSLRRSSCSYELVHPMCITWLQRLNAVEAHGLVHISNFPQTGDSQEADPTCSLGERHGSLCAAVTKCACCGDQHGCCIRCAAAECVVRMHPLCAILSGCYTGVYGAPTNSDATGTLRLPFCLCPYHTTMLPTSGV
jgi:hypothetical protein